MKGVLLCACLTLPTVALSQTPALTAPERRIAAAVDARNAQALALLERVVNINSGTMNFAGVRQVGDASPRRARCARLHHEVGGRGRFKRAGHLVAERTGAARVFC